VCPQSARSAVLRRTRTSGWIVVYDQQSDDFDLSIPESLALTLSTRLSCTALASCQADDDVLGLALKWHSLRTICILAERI
jgi:hypothetical protein